jgi:hypothetical protein
MTACSTSATSAPTPRSACSLLSVKQASADFGGPFQARECHEGPGDQSQGLYLPIGSHPGTMVVNVLWDNSAVTTFRVSHSGHAEYAAGDTPPIYDRVSVSGIPAYWQLSPAPSTENGPARLGGLGAQISTLKNGYVVILTSMSLSQAQDEKALASITNRL